MQAWSARLCCAATAACLTAALTTGFSASAAPVDYSKAASDFAGSQIARVEGVNAASSRVALDGTLGHDVSAHQATVDWSAARAGGARFVYVKATEGDGYTSPQFDQQYDGAYGAGLIRGAYHFARPDVSSGADQADYFLAHGGGWSADGKTLPGALDLEYNPYGDACYGKDPADMSAWIADFSNTYRAATGRFPVFYTSTGWWNTCTGGNSGFGTNPLWIARYNDTVGDLPDSWDRQTIWQYADSGNLPGDQNLFNGGTASLTRFARD